MSYFDVRSLDVSVLSIGTREKVFEVGGGCVRINDFKNLGGGKKTISDLEGVETEPTCISRTNRENWL